MQVQPLSKAIYEKALSLGITKIHLNFSGGNDEGYLNISIEGIKDVNKEDKFVQEIDEWAWGAYYYGGGGDGNDYGDDITYDLANKSVESSEWFMKRHDGEVSKEEFNVE